jgi:hypothetical protein
VGEYDPPLLAPVEQYKRYTYGLELEGKELETLVLETLDDLTNETALDTVGLDLLVIH